MYTYVIPCLLGLEKLVSDVCKRLGLQDVKAENGRVLCRGTLADCARLKEKFTMISMRCLPIRRSMSFISRRRTTRILAL